MLDIEKLKNVNNIADPKIRKQLKLDFLSKIKKVSKKQYTFQKIRLFAKRYELTYLNDNYLNCLKTKQVLI